MKLEKILDKLGSLEKNSFIKIIDNIISKNPKNGKEIEKILSSTYLMIFKQRAKKC